MEIGIDPVLFTIGSQEVRWYGVMVALAVLVGVAVPLWLSRKWGISVINENSYFWVAIVGVIGGVIGARLIHVFDEWGYFMDHPGEIIGGEGMGIYGAILGGTLFGVITARVVKVPIGRMVDVAAYGLILAQAVGRIGCFLNGCCYGTTTDLPWGTTWTHPDSYGPLVGAVHPTQIYELLFDLVLFAFLWIMRKRIGVPGAIYLIYISVYSVGRFLISFLRENEEAFLGLQQAQVVSLVVLFIAVGWLVYLLRKPVLEPEAVSSDETENT
ncbi:prolipoprotein diacylglyceryl transferase [Chloroflexota bacterium]